MVFVRTLVSWGPLKNIYTSLHSAQEVHRCRCSLAAPTHMTRDRPGRRVAGERAWSDRWAHNQGHDGSMMGPAVSCTRTRFGNGPGSWSGWVRAAGPPPPPHRFEGHRRGAPSPADHVAVVCATDHSPPAFCGSARSRTTASGRVVLAIRAAIPAPIGAGPLSPADVHHPCPIGFYFLVRGAARWGGAPPAPHQ